VHTAARPAAAGGSRRRLRRRVLPAAVVVAVAVGIGGSGFAAGATGTDRWVDSLAGALTGPAPGGTAAAVARSYEITTRRWDSGTLTEATPRWTSWRTVRVGGVLRRYLLSMPVPARGRAPLVVAFHGLGQRASTFATQTGLVAATRTAGQVLVLPKVTVQRSMTAVWAWAAPTTTCSPWP